MGLRSGRPPPPSVPGQAKRTDDSKDEASRSGNDGRLPLRVEDRVAEELGVVRVAQHRRPGHGRKTEDLPGAVIPADQPGPAGRTAAAAVDTVAPGLAV